MRLDICIQSTSMEVIPYNHQPALTAVVNKWLGANNKWHGVSSTYAFSMLGGGKAVKVFGGITFPQGATLTISAHDSDMIYSVVENLSRSPKLFKGLVVREVFIIADPDLSDREIFFPTSPILLKQWVEGQKNPRHVIYTDEQASDLLTEKFRTKLDRIGLSDPTARLTFAPEAGKHQTKLITYRNIRNRTSWCPIRIEGTPTTKLFAWNTGVGNSTGIGFGAIK